MGFQKEEQLHPGCVLCKQKNVAQSDVIDQETGRILVKKGDFAIQCKGIPLDPVEQVVQITERAGVRDELTDGDIKAMATVRDPVLWAHDNVTTLSEETGQRGPWVPQGASEQNIATYGLDPSSAYYQELMVKCTARRQVLRLGRRCLAAGEMVAMADGTFKAIDQISVGDRVLSRNMSRGTFVSKNVTAIYENGIQNIYRITLNDGSAIRCTANHPLLKSVAGPEGRGRSLQWHSIESGLSVGDKVLVARELAVFGSDSFVNEARLLGYLVTDGYLPEKGQTPKFTNTNPAYLEEVDNLTNAIFGQRGRVRNKQSKTLPAWDYHFTDGDHSTPSFIRSWLEEYQLIGAKASNKTVPKRLFSADKETVAQFINRCWSGDGCVFVGQPRLGRQPQLELTLTSASIELLKGTRLLLKKLGVHSRIKEEKGRSNWKLCVTGKTDLEAFLNTVGDIFGKEARSQEMRKVLGLITRQARNKGHATARLAKVASITRDGSEPTFDITVDKWHNFVVDGIVNHNSGKSWTITIKALHKMVTNKGYRVMVITPAQAQLDLIFDRVDDFIENSTSLKASKETYRKTPQRYIELTNGSFMIGFVSGNDGMRGQAADMIIIDEADYLDTDDLSAITAILTEHNNTILIVASTPTGKREQFYKWDHDPAFRSFHFPSMCRPNWNEGMELEMKKENPGVKYLHEILSDYGEIADGVFQHSHIDRALTYGDYLYVDNERRDGCIYCVGVDWNPVHGTEIVVVETDPKYGRAQYKVVDCGQVFREGNTQIQAINEIIRLNRKWQPEFIYVDRGAGNVQIELLQELGSQAEPNTPDKRLENIVKAVDFGSKIEMRHPVEGTVYKEYAKPAVVENAIRYLEADQIVLSKYDTNLIRALRGYIVHKVSANGRPVYKMVTDDIEDHRLDAWMLAMFAFTMEFSKLGTPHIVPTVAFTGMFGDAVKRVSSHISVPIDDNKPTSRALGAKEQIKIDQRELAREKELNYLPSHTIIEPTWENGQRVNTKIYDRTETLPRRSIGGRRDESSTRGRAPIKRSMFK